jgi:hypothetical protein
VSEAGTKAKSWSASVSFPLAALDIERFDVSPRARVADISNAAKPHVPARAVLGTFATP